QIGNTGVNDEDDESSRIWVAGYVVRDPARRPSNWRSTGDLGGRLAAGGGVWVAGSVVRDPAPRPSNWRSTGDLGERLAAEGVVGISGVDTRALTRHLRSRGAMRAGVSTVALDPGSLLARVRESPPMVGADLSREVTTPDGYTVSAVGEHRYTV